MALNPVSLDERFRPWFLAGVTHFLLPENAPLEPNCLLGQQLAAFQKTHINSTPHRAGVHTPEQAPSPASPKIPSPVKNQQPENPVVSSASWPGNWQDRLLKTPSAPVIWTYPELGADLSGNGDKARSSCLRELIGAAGLPKGSSSFWPLTLDDDCVTLSRTEHTRSKGEGTQYADSRYFREGLLILKPRALILFGSRSIVLGGLTLDFVNPFSQTVFQGILHILLPDFGAILEDNKTFSKTSVYLRASLTTLPGIFK